MFESFKSKKKKKSLWVS